MSQQKYLTLWRFLGRPLPESVTWMILSVCRDVHEFVLCIERVSCVNVWGHRMKLLAFPAALACVTVLSACGGSSTGGGNSMAISGGPGAPSILAIYAIPSTGGAGSGPFTAAEVDVYRAAIASLDDDLFSGSATTALPSAASATMTGLIGGQMGAGSREYLAGKITLNADFAGATIGGTTSDYSIFVENNSGAPVLSENLDGALTIADGTIFGNQFFFTDIDGTLSGAAGTYAVDGEIDGMVLEIDNAAGAQGDFLGTITLPNAVDVAIENGVFGASE